MNMSYGIGMNPLLVVLVISLVVFIIVSYSRYKFNQDLKESYSEVDELTREYESLIREHKHLLENEDEDETSED